MGKRIYNKLAWLNELPREEAVYVFSECSDSPQWAEAMADARPFPMLEHLFARAEDLAIGLDISQIEKKLEAVLER
ncbi:MAG TPA: 2-oxo-4-hydroxy-4-carboxy-5-ureidoimidazoline decarboxylase [Pyrinomonadaceae bacterium]|nr:2-oxo-4-hydroxy-4-carboxy-5-ureidoimidazoline decarboxylase [Pyrinomonadaceae bacterium]